MWIGGINMPKTNCISSLLDRDNETETHNSLKGRSLSVSDLLQGLTSLQSNVRNLDLWCIWISFPVFSLLSRK
jgi:hypothetical protein